MTVPLDRPLAFVVRTPSSWCLAPVPAVDPVPATLEDVLGALGSTGAVAEGSVAASEAADLPPQHDYVTPTWMWVGAVQDGCVLVEGPDGEVQAFDRGDLELLDRVTGPTSIGELLVEGHDPARVAKLARSGRVLTLREGVPPSPPEPEAPPAAARPDAAADAEAPSGPAPRAATLRAALARVPGARRVVAALRDLVDRPGPVVAEPAVAEPPLVAEPAVVAEPEPVPEPEPSAEREVSMDPPAPVAEEAPADGPVPAARPRQVSDHRIPVYAAWPEHVGPPLSLGMLTATARHWNDGALNETFQIRRPEVAEECLEDLAERGASPAVLLLSNYVWSLPHNIEVAQRAKAINPQVVVVHGGPSSPKYEADARAFLEEHGAIADVLVRGEGEEILCELLEVVAAAGGALTDVDALAAIEGITFQDLDGEVVRTADRARMADLDSVPSPYLSGEFDGLPGEAWKYCLSIETNRGCPYGCTFCDWGSATMSRIRKFDLDRAVAEFEWAANVGVHTVTITDANFGIMSRDVELTRRFAEIRKRTGHPHSLSWTAAKNTTKHLVQIMDLLVDSGMTVSTSLSLQTTDPTTLEVLARTNISTDHYVKLAADYRRRGFPLQGDLMLGLPGQTFESYKADLQFMLDHEIMVRSWPVQMLPNAPMNDPEYRERHGIVVGEGNLVTATATFSAEDRVRMFHYRTIDTIAERMGVLRHVMRYLQWDHGIPASDLMEHLLILSERDPERFPLVSWVFGYFDLLPTVAVGWHAFYAELRRLLVEDFGLKEDDEGLAVVLRLQEALMPAPGRTFPAEVHLEHDYLAYYRSATRSLWGSGHAGEPEDRLTAYPPATFTVEGDPLGLCIEGIHLEGDARNEALQGDFHIGAAVANELDSPLIRILPLVSGHGISNIPDDLPDDDADAPAGAVSGSSTERGASPSADEPTSDGNGAAVPVAILQRRP